MCILFHTAICGLGLGLEHFGLGLGLDTDGLGLGTAGLDYKSGTDLGTIPGLCAKVRSSEFRRVRYKINILGSQRSPSSINLVPAQAGKVIMGLASHWPCVTDTYGLNGQRQGGEHPGLCPFGAWHHLPYLTVTQRLTGIACSQVSAWN